MRQIVSILFICLFSFLFLVCSKKNKTFQFGSPFESQKVDSNGDGKIDTQGYYINDEGNFRLLYNEVDRNLDGLSDFMLWVGSSGSPKKDSDTKEIVKIHEEEDDDYDGKIDILRWYLPNDLIALTQNDEDKDGYFETTIYYNFKKLPIRTEVDTNSDGRADKIIWNTRAEIDTDFDGFPDSYTEAPTKVKLLDNIQRKLDIKPLEKSKSWFLNPSLIPVDYKAIIGSGY